MARVIIKVTQNSFRSTPTYQVKLDLSSHDRRGEADIAAQLASSIEDALLDGAEKVNGVPQPKQVSVLGFRSEVKSCRRTLESRQLSGVVPTEVYEELASLYKHMIAVEDMLKQLDDERSKSDD